jgi:outer membrane protein assembly factor BamB
MKKWIGTGWTGQPVKLGGTVFVGGVDRNLYAIDAETGTLAWRLQGGEMFKSSPCIYENRLYIGNVDNLLRCVDCATGEVVWTHDTGKDLDSSPCVVDDRLYVTGESGNAWCLEPRTGKVIWKRHIGGTGPGSLLGSNGSETSPAIADGRLYAATYDGELLCLDLAHEGKILWKANTGDDTDASAVLGTDRVITAAEEASPYVMCHDRATGKFLWKFDELSGADAEPPPKATRERTNGSGNYGAQGYWATPAIADSRVYAASQRGLVHRLSLETGAADWSTKVGGPVWSSPCVVDGKVIFGCSDGNLYMLDATSGAISWQHPLAGGCISTPCIVDGRIYVGDGGGTFHCFG